MALLRYAVPGKTGSVFIGTADIDECKYKRKHCHKQGVAMEI
jgi:hypothetical protein